MSFIDSLDRTVVSFFNYGTGTCIDLTGGHWASGTPVIGNSFHSGYNQQWVLHKANEDPIGPIWVIRNLDADTNLDLFGGGNDTGTKISGWDGGETTNNTHQLWRLIGIEGVVVMIQNVGAGTFVDLLDGNAADSTEISGWQGNTDEYNPHQLWRILAIDEVE
ncbi:carbohydrate-binding module family 13 protein [Hypoxylon rubiginosum]|uniref:Carbohydrate-binding module family 13 protein n=1 Tax=Hypoxylon rubiginosum TaxID=110542 RepID=A0ACC0CLB9_9PEZI|nr:carbohydrate-binding module family 13 protein [Hypoxylon rubiginosum]